MGRDLNSVFQKSAEFLLSRMNKDGFWEEKVIKHGEPPVYYRNVIPTSLAIHSLIFTKQPNVSKFVRSGIFHCNNYDIEEHDDLDLWSAKLHALNLSNMFEEEKSKIVKLLEKKQIDGFWPKYPGTSNLTNFKVIQALSSHALPNTMEKAIDWFRKNKAADGFGWAREPNEKKSFTTFTANVILGLVLAGEDVNQAYIQNARKFLEKNQNKDGSWPSSPITLEKPTSYATAICALALMVTSTNPLNEQVEKAIGWLVSNMHQNGGWALAKKEQPEIYTTYYALQTLAFYDYYTKNVDETRFFKKILTPAQTTSLSFRNFLKKELQQELISMAFNDAINSRALAATVQAIQRRKDILKILKNGGTKDVAAIIDELNKMGYNLNKKSHMTQVKFDVEHLREMSLIGKIRNEYYISFDFGF